MRTRRFSAEGIREADRILQRRASRYSPEALQLFREIHKHPIPEETRQKIAQSCLGRKHSLAVRKKISVSQKVRQINLSSA